MLKLIPRPKLIPETVLPSRIEVRNTVHGFVEICVLQYLKVFSKQGGFLGFQRGVFFIAISNLSEVKLNELFLFSLEVSLCLFGAGRFDPALKIFNLLFVLSLFSPTSAVSLSSFSL